MKPINHTDWKISIENSETKDENKKMNLNCNKLNNTKTKFQYENNEQK